MKFNVRFTINRFPLRNMYRAIETVGKDFLFPTSREEDGEENSDVVVQKSFFNRDIEQNLEQKRAVIYSPINLISEKSVFERMFQR